MSRFFSLTGYELLKILKRKSTWVLLTICLGAVVLCVGGVVMGDYYVDGVKIESMYDGMVKDRNYSRELAGRPVDSELLQEMVRAYQKVPPQPNYTKAPEYQTYARPYSQIFGIVRDVKGTALLDVQKMTGQEIAGFYEDREELVNQRIDGLRISGYAKEKLHAYNDRVETPFIFSYTDGYSRGFYIMNTTSLLAFLITAVCLAPMFAGEYANRTDQLLLSSRCGKGMLIGAKLFAGMVFAVGIFAVMAAVNFGTALLLLGGDGAQAAIQLFLPDSVYPLTVVQLAWLIVCAGLLAQVLVAAMTLLLSARMQSPFGVLVVMFGFLIFPLFVKLSDSNVLQRQLMQLLPTNMATIQCLISDMLYSAGKIAVPPYVFLPLFAGAAALCMLPPAFWGFKRHQVK